MGSNLSVSILLRPRNMPDLLGILDFSKTLFTPAGLDVYLRKPLAELGEEGQGLLRAIVEGIVGSPEEAISKLAREGGFIVGGA
jgi:hypothetical protein